MKLFVFDVDGTLINDDEPTPELIAAVNERLAKGDAVAIASGRPYTGIKPYLDYFQPGLKYSLGANGVIVQKEDGSVLKDFGMDPQEFLDFYARHEKEVGDGMHLYCYTEKELGCFDLSSSVKWELECNFMTYRNLNKRPFTKNDKVLKFMLSSTAEKIESFPIYEEDKQYQILRSSPNYLEFVRKDADKASGVEFLRQYLNIEKENVYCFGDQGNDVLMIRNYQGVAMGNATEECKRAAKFVTKPVWENGVAFALKKFVNN
ncbi:MAG: Cof-type HAD-IIB family hydrolase [Bacilli bacterium]|nr:Cof-type HAD-IIB family hydrolase [Bacilli bacterium]